MTPTTPETAPPPKTKDRLLSRARDARIGLDAAKAEYADALVSAHNAGASYSEIASAIGYSKSLVAHTLERLRRRSTP